MLPPASSIKQPQSLWTNLNICHLRFPISIRLVIKPHDLTFPFCLNHHGTVWSSLQYCWSLCGLRAISFSFSDTSALSRSHGRTHLPHCPHPSRQYKQCSMCSTLESANYVTQQQELRLHQPWKAVGRLQLAIEILLRKGIEMNPWGLTPPRDKTICSGLTAFIT